MSMNFHKKEDEAGLVSPVEQDHLDNSSSDEKSTEYDVIGTALNDI